MANLLTWLKLNKSGSSHKPFESAGFCHVGKVRQDNQDSFLADSLLIKGMQSKDYEGGFEHYDQRGLYIVLDGMGGEADGGLASALTAEYFSALVKPFLEGKIEAEEMPQRLNEKLQEANRRLVEHGKTTGGRSGTTVCGFFRDKDIIRVFHVGDSRCYLWRKQKLYCLTEDHTRAQQLFKMGVITQSEIESHEGRNTLTRHVGIDEKKYGLLTLDMTSDFKLEPEDKIILATDGAYASFSDPRVNDALNLTDVYECVKTLKHIVLEGDATDNLTCVVTKF